MLKKVIIYLAASIILSGCATGPEGYFKKSANNQLIDAKGAKGSKRAPLYNKKYIVKAKKNVVSGEYDDDEDFISENDEQDNIALANREMYREMIRQDMEREQKKRNKWSLFSRNNGGYDNNGYPPMSYASRNLEQEDYSMNEMREELREIKELLYETEQDLASYKCPTAAELEKSHAINKKAVNPKKTSKPKPPVRENNRKSDDNNSNLDPVHSI